VIYTAYIDDLYYRATVCFIVFFVFNCFYLLSFFSLAHSDIVIAVFILGLVSGLL